MKLYYWSDRRNFGDELNLYIIPRLAPDLLDDDDSTLFLGIGTVMNEKVPTRPRKIVFSSGIGYSSKPLLDDRWHFYCVRGPLTQDALGLPDGTAVSDAGVLIRDYFERRARTSHHFGFLPHWSHDNRPLKRVAKAEGLMPISPMRSPEDVIRDIAQVEVLVTESLHGAIVADSLRIPWIPVKLDDNILDFKWHDWCATVGIEYRPTEFSADLPEGGLRGRRTVRPFADQLRECCRTEKPVLSKEGVISDLCEILKERLHQIQLEWPK